MISPTFDGIVATKTHQSQIEIGLRYFMSSKESLNKSTDSAAVR
jgi:hypothetical protein